MPYGKGSKRAGTKSGGGPHKTPYKLGYMGNMNRILGLGGGGNRPSSMGAFGFGASGIIANQLQEERARRSKSQAHFAKPRVNNDPTPRSSGGGGLHTAARAVGQSMFGGFRKLSRGKYEK